MVQYLATLHEEMMHIPEAVFNRFVPDPPSTTEGALTMVRQRYCDVLSRQNKCPQKCEACKAILQGMFDIGPARSPSGALRWRIDNLVQGRISIWTSEAKNTPRPLDSIGLPKTGNPFEGVLGQF